jgi:hypothetical protein
MYISFGYYFQKWGFGIKKYRTNFFCDLIPKICVQNVYKNEQSVKKLSSGSKTLHKALCNTNIRIPYLQKNLGPPLPPTLCYFGADKQFILIFNLHILSYLIKVMLCIKR